MISEQACDKYLSTVTSIWDSIGLPDTEKNSRIQIVVCQMTANLTASIDAENQFKHSLDEKLDVAVSKLRLIECELGVEPYEVCKSQFTIYLSNFI